ncbi:AAA family ATPase [Paracoccus sp. (in: a-proteobacteria)]|uniref:AAA family ATPase n=1 Tax=Paracoccus sp. TaxID=267 RepID=UPI0028A60B41|nr:AAA family ATPase [Paracoccus sp. (in: a-proteobacteria)]
MFEQKGGAVIGLAGIGKSRMITTAIRKYELAVQATGGRQFGYRIVSAVVLGQASVKDTCCAILEKIGYPANSTRSEHYLINCVSEQLQHHRIAAIHLDEVQGAGRHATTTAKSNFAKRFRNLMQNAPWPVCLILSSTLEGKDFSITTSPRPNA